MATRRPQNEELPQWVEAQWFQHTFVMTYMAFVGQTTNPWDVLVKQSVQVMQKIWDATSCYEYEITASAAIYQKVRDRLHSRTILKYNPDGSMPLQLLAQCYRICRHCTPLGILRYSRKLTRFRWGTCRVCKVLPGGSSLFVSSKWTQWQKGMWLQTLFLQVYMSNNNIILFRNRRGSFAAPLSSRRLLLTSWLSKVPWGFPISTTNPQPLQWVG